MDSIARGREAMTERPPWNKCSELTHPLNAFSLANGDA